MRRGVTRKREVERSRLALIKSLRLQVEEAGV